jgi:class 3 adenylate cyclase
MLNRWFETLDGLADEHGVYKLETIGDAFLAATNLLAPQPDHAARMARFALAATAAAESTLVDETDPARGTLQIRAGINSGPCMAAVIGRRNPKYASALSGRHIMITGPWPARTCCDYNANQCLD